MAIILLSSPSCSVSSSSASSCVPPASTSLCNSTPLEKAGAAWRRTVLLFSTQPLPSLAPAPSPPPFLRWQPQRRVEHRPSATAAKHAAGAAGSSATGRGGGGSGGARRRRRREGEGEAEAEEALGDGDATAAEEEATRV
jgi:hypothetical protein